MRVLVVLPTYNEYDNVTAMLGAITEALPDAGILVVDDGSPDGTADAAEKFSVMHPHVAILRRARKDGLGSAYRAGFAWGLEQGYDAFVEMDCDFSHDPKDLPRLVALAETSEVVIGSRYVPGGSIPRWSKSRQWLSREGNRYASAMLRLGVADSTAGFRVYRASALQKIGFQRVRADGYGFQIEMTYRARQHGASIVEAPIRFVDRQRGESKMSMRIVVEALLLVTWWGVGARVRRTPSL